MTEKTADKINPLSIADKTASEDTKDVPIGFVVICDEGGMPTLHQIPDHRSPNDRELFHINWFLTGSLIGGILSEPKDGEPENSE